jgi:multiple sugar transport system permease protein
VLNSVLKSLRLIGQYVLFIGAHQVQTIFLVSLVQVWQITPLAALIVLAALQSVPGELYEAAAVYGAPWHRVIRSVTLPLVRITKAALWARLSRHRVIRSVTLPLVWPALAVATVEALVMSLNIFGQVYVLNANATTGSSIMSTTYFNTFQDLNFGEGYALILLATVVTVLLAAAAVKLIYRKVEY